LHFVYENYQSFVQFRKCFQRRRRNFSNETRAFAEKESQGESGTQIKTTFCALLYFFLYPPNFGSLGQKCGRKERKNVEVQQLEQQLVSNA